MMFMVAQGLPWYLLVVQRMLFLRSCRSYEDVETAESVDTRGCLGLYYASGASGPIRNVRELAKIETAERYVYMTGSSLVVDT